MTCDSLSSMRYNASDTMQVLNKGLAAAFEDDGATGKIFRFKQHPDFQTTI